LEKQELIPVKRSPEKKREISLVAGILLAALVWQGFLFFSGRSPLDGDECYMAIQGLDIIRGARPVFYYSQNYMGCIEAYLYAPLRLAFGSSTPLAVKSLGAIQMILFLLSSYLLIRRFFERATALVALLLLAFPPNMLALWYLKIRGYMPLLLLGNAVFYFLFLLDVEEKEARGRNFLLLGILLGLSWWANPVAVFYLASSGMIVLLSSRLRNLLLKKSFSTPQDIFINGTAILILAILVSRSIIAPRRLALLRFFYDFRPWILAGLGLAAAAAIVVYFRSRARNIFPAAICLGFLTGNLPMLFIYWTNEFLNLKQSLGNLRSFWDNMTLSPVFVFPVMAGLTDVLSNEPSVMFGPAGWGLLSLVWICMGYYTIRRLGKERRPFVYLMVFIGLTLLIYWANNGLAWVQTRYLLVLYLPLLTLMACFIRELDRQARGLGVAILALVIGFHLAGSVRLPREELLLPSGKYPYERDILNYCRDEGIERAFILDSDTGALRLTLFTEQKRIFLHPMGYFNRITRYEEAFLGDEEYNLFLPEDLPPAGSFIRSEDNVPQFRRPSRPPDARLPGIHVYRSLSRKTIKELYNPYFM